uniref:Ribosomal protein S16 n=1 Tax=Platycladus orientalis TaxID=58046 RepID=A0A1S5UN34_9CONI|nr:ribosomal protein S16 [Platycladus orientalis]
MIKIHLKRCGKKQQYFSAKIYRFKRAFNFLKNLVKREVF